MEFIVGFLLVGAAAYYWFLVREDTSEKPISQWDIINYVDSRIPILPPGIWHIDTFTKDGSNWLTLNLRDESGNVVDHRTVNTTYRYAESKERWDEFSKFDFYQMLEQDIVKWALGYKFLQETAV